MSEPEITTVVQGVAGVDRRTAEGVVKAFMDAGWWPPRPTPHECETEGDGHNFEELCTRCWVDPYEYFGGNHA